MSDWAVRWDVGSVDRTFKSRQTVVDVDDFDGDVDWTGKRIMNGSVTGCDDQMVNWLTLVVQGSAVQHII